MRASKLFAGRAKPGPHLAQQLHLELVYQQLEQRHLSVARLNDSQERVNSVGRFGGLGHSLNYAIANGLFALPTPLQTDYFRGHLIQ